MYEATIAISDSSAYTKPTDGTDCRIELWCNEHADLLYITGSTIEPVISRVLTDIGIDELIRGDEEAVVITSSCLKRHETTYIERYLESHNSLLLPPLRYENGAKHCRILAIESESLSNLYAELVDDGFTIDVQSKREIDAPTQSSPLLTLDQVLPELTARQRETMVLAVENGYYELPRETTTETLANELGVSRRTAEDHLRRAERKIITSLVSYLY